MRAACPGLADGFFRRRARRCSVHGTCRSSPSRRNLRHHPTASAPRLAPEGEEILATLERIDRIAGYEG